MADDLRARIAEALDGAFTTVADFDAETAADAVLAIVQPELDRLTAERDQARAHAQRLHSTLLHFAAEAHRRKWRYDLGEDAHGSQIKSPAFDALHWLGNDLLAALNKTRQEPVASCCDVPSAAPCEQDNCPGTRTTTKE